MKTRIPFYPCIMTVALSFMLLCCMQENMLPKDKTVSTGAIETVKTTSKDMPTAGGSEKIQPVLPITKEMEDAVAKVTKPAREAMEKLLSEDKTGMYEGYKKDASRLSAVKDFKENEIFIAEMYEKYLPFFQETWMKAGIDEKAYQAKIKNIFPEEIQETIEFTEFLNFSTHVKKHTRDYDPNPAPPAPENICVDATTLLFGIEFVEKSGLANATTFLLSDYIEAWSVAEWAGLGKATAGLASNISIPGTFPDDSRILRVTKSFQWKGYATAFSGLGCSFASMYYTTVANEEFSRLWAPVTWLSTISKDEPKTEDYLLQKRYLYNIRYGVSTYADSYGGFAAIGTSKSSCENIRWNICEE